MTNINLEHPDYAARKYMWRKYRDLYAGGEQMKLNASEYLTRRQKEPHDVYSERLGRVFYENYTGSIIDWYAATLFRREPQIIDGTGLAGYTELDLRAAWFWKRFEFSLTGQNLLHASHVEFGAADQRGGIQCSLLARITWRQ